MNKINQQYSAREFLDKFCTDVDNFEAVINLYYYYHIELDEAIELYKIWRWDYVHDIE